MTALAATAPRGVGYDPLRDARHRTAAAAQDLEDWLKYLELANRSPRTVDTYERYGASLLRDWPDIAFPEFDASHLSHSLMRHPAKSRHVVKSAWNKWFEWGVDVVERVPKNPATKLPRIKYQPSRTYDVFTDAETAALCALPSPHGELMTLLFWTGLRRAEARMMTAKRLDLDRGQVLILEGAKGGKHRQVPMVEPVRIAAAQLFLLEGLGPDDFLWGQKPGGGPLRRVNAISNTSFDVWWKKALEAAGVRHRNPHMARHTMATMWRRRGLPMEAVQLLLGHESISTTSDTYISTEVEEVGDLMRELVTTGGTK